MQTSSRNRLSALNPNWAQLQQKLKSHGGRKPLPVGKPDSESKVPTPAARVLGKRKEMSSSDDTEPSKPSILTPTSSDCSLTDVVAMDCEMVGVSSEGNKSALGRITLVNTYGNVIYDEYVRPLDWVVDFRTRISGIRPKDLRKAKEFQVVQKDVSDMIKGKILVGHALHNDLKVLLLSHPKKDIRDTSEYQPLQREGRKRSLKDLATHILGVSIQQNQHCPVEDARATMLIYNKYRKGWEKSTKALLKKIGNKNKRRKKNP